MTVSELIDALKDLPQDLTVMAAGETAQKVVIEECQGNKYVRIFEPWDVKYTGTFDHTEAESELSDMTNGEILKTIFPSITEKFNNRPDEIIVSGLDVNEKVFQLDWWNKPYKENK